MELTTRRQEFRSLLCCALQNYWPTMQLIIAKLAPMLSLGYKPGIVRLLFKLWPTAPLIAAVGVAPWERVAVIQSLLEQAIIWKRETARRFASTALYLFVPVAYVTRFQQRVRLLVLDYPIEIVVVNDDFTFYLSPVIDAAIVPEQERLATNYIRHADHHHQGSLAALTPLATGCSPWRPTQRRRRGRLTPLPQYRPPPRSWPPALQAITERIKSLNPNITVLRTFQRLKLALHGLVFATADYKRPQELWFGVEQPQLLTSHNDQLLEALVRELSTYRQAASPNKQHRFYTMAAEAWLESLIVQQLPRLDSQLLPGQVYRQVPQLDATGRHFVDLLALRRDGQLVIMELKVTEDEMLPFQALDYWWLVEQHRRRGDFQRRGYFVGQPWLSTPCWIYLVAPIFRFHQRCRELAATINPSIPVLAIAINNDWRENLTVYRRELWNPVVGPYQGS